MHVEVSLGDLGDHNMTHLEGTVCNSTWKEIEELARIDLDGLQSCVQSREIPRKDGVVS